MEAVQGQRYYKLINEVFISIIGGPEFEIRQESESLFIAKKGDLELLFRLEVGYQSHHFSLEIRLSGELGERATSDSHYRHLGVTAITKCYDQNYEAAPEGADTDKKLKELMEIQKRELLKYCADILAGDVSSWSGLVECLRKKRDQSKYKIPRR